MEDKKVAIMLGEAEIMLQRKYSVRISVSALRALDSMLIPEDTSAGDVLDRACQLVMEKFRNYAHDLDLKFNKKAYDLRRSIVELGELYRSDHPDSKFWVARLRSERDAASFYMDWWLCRWDFGLNEIFDHQTRGKLRLFNEGTSEEPSDHTPFNEASGIVRFLDGIQDQLVYCFRSLTTVKDCHVAEVLSKLTDVPRTQIDTSMKDHHKKIAIKMTNHRVMNQGRVIKEIFETLASESMTARRRPRASFLLLGPSGVGKTEIAKAVARHWYCDESKLVEIDMSEHVEPPVESTEGSKRACRYVWNQLIEAVTKRPYSVIVLDKIDKASSTVITVLLEVLSCGATRDIDGDTVDFSKAIFFMTSSVGSDQLELPCTCYEQQYNDLPQQSRRPSKMKFYMAHRCPLKYNVAERVIDKAKETLDADLIGSLDKVLVVKKFTNKRAVGRLILRETVRDAYGERLVVHASNEAIDALFRKASKLDVVPGHKFRQALLDHVIPKLPATEDHLNVYVDTFVGTYELSFRFCAHTQNVGDFYFKLEDGTFDNFMAELKRRAAAAYKLLDLRSECLRLYQSDGSLYELKKLVSDARNEFATCSQYQDICTLTLLPCVFKEIASCDDNLPTAEEKHTFEKHLKELEGQKTGVGEATRTILGSLVETSDAASLESRSLPPTRYFFLGLNDDAKAGLLSSLNDYLGESFFMHVKLDNNCRGEEVKKLIVDRVRKRPCTVLMLDGVEFADDVLYKSLLAILDKGTLEDESIEFRRMILILTSDAENKRGIALAAMFKHKSEVIYGIAVNPDRIMKRFRTELLYRVEKVMVFDPVSEHGGTPFSREHGVRYEKPFDELWLSRFLHSVFLW